MRRLPEVLLLRMRDQTAGQGIHLRQLRSVVKAAAHPESNQADTFERPAAVPSGEESFCQRLRWYVHQLLPAYLCAIIAF